MRGGLVTWAVVLVPLAASAHDVAVDVSGSLITTSQNNPRAGSVGVMASGGWDVSDSVSLFTNLGYTRDLPTQSGAQGTPETRTSGSNVFLAALGLLWLPADDWMTMLTLSGSPPAFVRSATTLYPSEPLPPSINVVVDSRSWTVGALWTGTWMQPPHDGPWSSLLDAVVGATWFDVFQQVEVPDTPAGARLTEFCAASTGALCQLVKGASTPLLQVRLGGGYTGTLFETTDFGLEVQGFLYDRDPADVGYFSVVNLGRGLELGNGVPMLPLAVSVRPSVLHRFSRVSLKLAYQFGLYAGDRGTNHVLTLRATVKVSKSWRIQATVTGQLDADASSVGNFGGFAVVGTTVVF
jgi:hypothetical protein